jgi:hypothetical protein
MIPPGLQGGPPVAPPEMPTLSAMPMDGQTAPPGAGLVGALPRLFHNVEQELETIARVLPPALAAEMGPIVSQLRAVLVKALQSGAGSFGPPSLEPPMGSLTSPGGPRPESGMP